MALGQWGSRIPVSDSTNQDLSVDALIFALTTTFDADIASQVEAVVQLRVGDGRFRTGARRGHFRVARDQADKADENLQQLSWPSVTSRRSTHRYSAERR